MVANKSSCETASAARNFRRPYTHSESLEEVRSLLELQRFDIVITTHCPRESGLVVMEAVAR